jgi:FkbM family methyltransferase
LPSDWYRDLIIYDVGMNTGQDTEYYLKKGFRVVAIEANPLLCEEAQVRFASHIESGRLKILNVGIAKENGWLDFFVNQKNSEWSSFHRNIAGRAGDDLAKIHIEVATMEQIISEEGIPYYLKIDIEGNDMCALKSTLQVNGRIPYISVENGSTMLPMLHVGGYSHFKYIQQNDIDQQTQTNPPLEGEPAVHTFEFGASGKFGEETDGEWMNYEEACIVVGRTWNIETGAKNSEWDDATDGWFDLHARHENHGEAIRELLDQTL